MDAGANPVFVRCEFSGNTVTTGQGAAVYLNTTSGTQFICCTIAQNTDDASSGFYVSASTLSLNSCIVGYNTGSLPVVAYGGSVMDVRYTNVFGNPAGDWAGPLAGMETEAGNLCADPLFQDLIQGDYHIDEDSPCVDAGDPDLPGDPDESCCDQGAYFVWQDPTIVSVNLSAQHDPWYLGPNGGQFYFTAEVNNNHTAPLSFDAWTMVTLPNGAEIGPLLQQSLTLPADSDVSAGFWQNVPPSAPAGYYTYTAHVGLFGQTIVDSDAIIIVKVGFEPDGESGAAQPGPTLTGWGNTRDTVTRTTLR